MLSSLPAFFQHHDLYFWILELVIMTASWVVLRIDTSKEKKSLFQILAESILLFLLMAVLNLLCVAVSRERTVFIILWQLASGIAAALYLMLCSGYQRNTKLLLWSAQFTAQLSISAIAGQCSLLAGGFQGGSTAGIIRVTIYFLMVLTAVFLRRFNFDEYKTVPRSGLQLIGFGTACVLVFYIVEVNFSMDQSRQVTISLLAAYLCMFGIVLGIIRVLYVMCQEQEAILDLQAEKQRFQSEKELTKMTETTLEDLRCIRHDLKNQYAYMQILLAEKRYPELQEYFTSLSDHLPPQLNIVDCGNSTVNTILNMEFTKLRADNIRIEHQLVVPPVLPFSDDDLCAILANMLDNAAEECRRLQTSGKEDVDIRLEIYPHLCYLYIKCSNSTDRTALDHSKGGLLTTKEDKQLHGYGTRIITKLSEKYNGTARFSIENSRFVAQIMLDMTEGRHYEN